MDHFGIGAAIAGAARIYLTAARQTGRTTSLLDSVRDGDRIIFANILEAGRCKQILAQRKLQVECVVISPRSPEHIHGMDRADGRTIFDHTWVEQFYLDDIERTRKMIDQMQDALSNGEPPQGARPDRRWGFPS